MRVGGAHEFVFVVWTRGLEGHMAFRTSGPRRRVANNAPHALSGGRTVPTKRLFKESSPFMYQERKRIRKK